MRSRYDFMTAGQVVDEDGDKFPDPLTAPFNNVQFTQIPGIKQVSDIDILKFWTFMVKEYNIQDLDDVLLSLNQVPYIGYLEPGDSILLIDLDDLKNFGTQRLVGKD